MIITISGDPGSGKTTLAEKLARVTRFENLYVGGLMREAAAAAKMTLEEFYEKLSVSPERERKFDALVASQMVEKENLIVQGRVAFYIAKQVGIRVINVFLAVHPYQGAERLAKRPEHANRKLDDIRFEALGRQATEQARYRELYRIDNHRDPKHFDIVIDTTALHPDAVLEKVLAALAVILLKKMKPPED